MEGQSMLESINDRICAVVVTYNRKKLLMECLDAILKQTYPVENIILIDNASTDGTETELKEKGYFEYTSIIYKKMDKNLGGSGGFYEGLKYSKKLECNWVWIMDDDTIPNLDCLEQFLISKKQLVLADEKKEISFLASSVFGPDDEPMNVPVIDTSKHENGYMDWYRYLSEGMVRIKNATFVSLLINADAIEKCGLPCKDYFIWGDDTEYTCRLTTYYGNAYFVGNSRVCHKRVGAKSLSILNEADMKRIENYRYFYRNNMVNNYIYFGKKRFIKDIVINIKFAIECLIKHKNGFAKGKVIIKGILAAVSERKKFKKYIMNELNR